MIFLVKGLIVCNNYTSAGVLSDHDVFYLILHNHTIGQPLSKFSHGLEVGQGSEGRFNIRYTKLGEL